MSQSNEQGEEGERNDPVAEEFEFYFPFAKTLALDLCTPEDKSIAAAWVQKLEAEPETDEEKQTRLNYLKLLLFVLQRGRLSGIFKKQPPSGALQPFPQGLSIQDMGNMMLNQDDAPSCGQGDARFIPYSIEISNDLREYVASQEIPNFGVQMYYAWSSDDPIHKWLSFDEDKFPQFVLDKIKQLKEIKSDEKTSAIKSSGCINVKKGCDISILDKSCRKKVKSPQEIEKSTGRSYHTYMGLVGRMGNFDKCNDDQDKNQRQDSRRGKGTPRETARSYPGSGGSRCEAQNMMGEDDCEDQEPNQGGLNSINRPCLCVSPNSNQNALQRWRNAQLPPKGGSQSCDAQQLAAKSNPCNMPCDPEPPYCNSSGSRRPQRQSNEEQCPENAMVQSLQRQRRSPSPRGKSNAGSRVDDCPQPENVEDCENVQSNCICPSSSCSCPCPRNQGPAPTRRTPSSAKNLRGGKSPNASRASFAAMAQCRNNRKPPTPEQENCPSGSGGRANEGKKLPLILHCYSENSPDPTLLQVVGKMNPSHWPEEENAYPQQGKACQGPSRSQTPPTMGQRSRSPVPSRARTPTEACRQNEPPKDPSPPCRPSNQQIAFNVEQVAQDYLEYDALPPNRPKQQRPEIYRKPISAPCPASQPMFRPKAYYSNYKQAGPPDCADRMSSMANVLQGIKQKTEAHREKCDVSGFRKSPPKDANYCQGPSQLPQNICPEPGPSEGGGMANYSAKGRSTRNSPCPEGGAYSKQQMKCPTHMPEAEYNDPCGSRMPQQFSRKQAPQPCPSSAQRRTEEECDGSDEGINNESTESEDDCCPKEPEPDCYKMPPQGQGQTIKWAPPKIRIQDTQGNIHSYMSPASAGIKPNCSPNEWTNKPMPKSVGRVLQQEQCFPSAPQPQNYSSQKAESSKRGVNCMEPTGRPGFQNDTSFRQCNKQEPQFNAEAQGRKGGSGVCIGGNGGKQNDPCGWDHRQTNSSPGRKAAKQCQEDFGNDGFLADCSTNADAGSRVKSSKGSRETCFGNKQSGNSSPDDYVPNYDFLDGNDRIDFANLQCAPMPYRTRKTSLNCSHSRSTDNNKSWNEGDCERHAVSPENYIDKSSGFDPQRKGRAPQQMAYKNQNYGQPECYNQMQPQNYPAQDCPQQNYRLNYKPNTYIEKSLYGCKETQKLKSSSPKEWMGSVSQENFPSLSEIRQCVEDDEPLQEDMCDNDEGMEYIPLNSMNCNRKGTDVCQVLEFNEEPPCDFNEMADENPSCPSLNGDENYDGCDNVGYGNDC